MYGSFLIFYHTLPKNTKNYKHALFLFIVLYIETVQYKFSFTYLMIDSFSAFSILLGFKKWPKKYKIF